MSEQVVISSGDLAARIDPLGAELVSLTDASGAEWMTDADPAFWTGHAPLLFPIVGRLNGDVLRVNGREYPMKQHGFARRMDWELCDAGPDAVTFQLAESGESLAQFPFRFALSARFNVVGSTLGMAVEVSNPGDVVLPFAFGFHPAFAWPLPGGGGKGGHAIIFDQEESQDILRLSEGGLVARHEPTPFAARRLVLDPALFAADALIWDQIASRRIAYRSPAGPWLEVAHNLPMLGIWQKPGANFICIEPWAGHADPAGFAGEFVTKPGITLLPPGAARTFRMDVTLHQG